MAEQLKTTINKKKNILTNDCLNHSYVNIYRELVFVYQRNSMFFVIFGVKKFELQTVFS